MARHECIPYYLECREQHFPSLRTYLHAQKRMVGSQCVQTRTVSVTAKQAAYVQSTSGRDTSTLRCDVRLHNMSHLATD